MYGKMLHVQMIRFWLFIVISKIALLHSATTTYSLPTTILDIDTNGSVVKIVDSQSVYDEKEGEAASKTSSEDITNIETIVDEAKNEINVNTMLERDNDSSVINILEDQATPYYEIDWNFIDKDTIRVLFELFSVPKSLNTTNLYSEPRDGKQNIFATMTAKPSTSFKSLSSLEYFHFTIRPYNQHREIILKMEKLHLKNATSQAYSYYSNALRLTSLNNREKYSVCICYYKTNDSRSSPDFLVCQDIINDYAKFSHLRADAKHGLVFITTQYSIIVGLLVVLQSVFTMRKRRITQFIAQHVATTAHNIRTTLSSVSLVRQSFSSLEAANEHQHQQNASTFHSSLRDSTINEEDTAKMKKTPTSPTITINQALNSVNEGVSSADEAEPFLKRISSRNHVHFLLGQGEGSDDDHENEDIDIDIPKTVDSHSSRTSGEPYGDQADAVLSMAHILDTNKPWSRYTDHTTPN